MRDVMASALEGAHAIPSCSPTNCMAVWQANQTMAAMGSIQAHLDSHAAAAPLCAEQLPVDALAQRLPDGHV